MAWSDIPTCKESGVDTEYQMLRGIFMSPGVKPEQVAYYVDLFKKVMATRRLEEVHGGGRLQPDLHDRRRVQDLGRGNRQAPLRPDEGSGLPGCRQIAIAKAAPGIGHTPGAAAVPPAPQPYRRETRYQGCMRRTSAAAEGPALVSNTAMEIVVALLLLGGSAIVITDSIRVGFGWQEGVGPAPGYFPFWVAVILGVSSLIILVPHFVVRPGDGEMFVSVRPFGRVLAVLVPSSIYVALIGGISARAGYGAGHRHLRVVGHLHLRLHAGDRSRGWRHPGSPRPRTGSSRAPAPRPPASRSRAFAVVDDDGGAAQQQQGDDDLHRGVGDQRRAFVLGGVLLMHPRALAAVNLMADKVLRPAPWMTPAPPSITCLQRGSPLPSSARSGACRCASTHVLNSSPVMKVWLNAPCSMNLFQSSVAITFLNRST